MKQSVTNTTPAEVPSQLATVFTFETHDPMQAMHLFGNAMTLAQKLADRFEIIRIWEWPMRALREFEHAFAMMCSARYIAETARGADTCVRAGLVRTYIASRNASIPPLMWTHNRASVELARRVQLIILGVGDVHAPSARWLRLAPTNDNARAS